MANTHARRVPRRLKLATLLVLVMWAFFQLYQPWQPLGPDLLRGSGDFEQPPTSLGWRREQGRLQWHSRGGVGGSATVELAPRARLRYPLQVDHGVMLLLVEGSLKTRALRTGSNSWDAARILLYFEDANGQIHWSHPHNVGFSSGDSDWHQRRAQISVPVWAERSWLELTHAGREGRMWADALTVVPAVIKPDAPHWRMFFAMLWAASFVLLLVSTNSWRLPWARPALVTGIVIVVAVTLPPATMYQLAKQSAALSQSLLQTTARVIAEVPAPVRQSAPSPSRPASEADGAKAGAPAVAHPLRGLADAVPLIRAQQMQKIGHVGLFALLGLFALRAFWHRRPMLLVGYALTLFAVAAEVLQLAVEGRLFGGRDLLLNLGGLAVGSLIGWLWARYSPAARAGR